MLNNGQQLTTFLNSNVVIMDLRNEISLSNSPRKTLRKNKKKKKSNMLAEQVSQELSWV